MPRGEKVKFRKNTTLQQRVVSFLIRVLKTYDYDTYYFTYDFCIDRHSVGNRYFY